MIKIRTATISDLLDLQNLNHKIMFQNSEFDNYIKVDFDISDLGAKYFKEIITNTEGLCLIAFDGKVPVGYINGLPKLEEYRTGKVFQIENLGVIPDYKKKGIATSLYKALLQTVKDLGFDRVYLSCFYENKIALEFYEHLGFNRLDIGLEKLI